MNIGFLDRRISFYAPSTTRDNYGAKSGSATLYTTVWAALDNKSASGSVMMEQETSVNRVVWRVRSSSTTRAITPKYTIQYSGDTYEILAIEEVGRNAELHFHTQKVVSE
jgi:SPP1 family predicted phage head-tail adaptor